MFGSSFRKRVATALVLMPLVVAGVLLLPTPYLALIFAAIVLLGGMEWTRLAGIHSFPGKILYLALLATLLWLTQVLVGFPRPAGLLFAGVGVWWVGVTLYLYRIRELSKDRDGFHPLRAAAGILVLGPAWAALVMIHGSGEAGPPLVVFLLFLIWVADSGAYFTGLRWGRNKLAPVISPGKTREGLYGALAGAVLCGALLSWLLRGDVSPFLPILLCLATVLFSVVGDLFESVLKRKSGLKDSGNLLPGHGGMLDRIDSLTAAAPVFLLGLMLLGVA